MTATAASTTPASSAACEPLDVRGALRGERLFITGATGFIGKVLVEKLLWSVPEIGRLVLLVRPREGAGAGERLRNEILDSPCMARLRALHGDDWPRWAAEKVSAIEGDLAMDRFGLDRAAYENLAGRIDRVVAAAAAVAFDAPLDRAVELNARGALRTLRLAREAGEVPLLHVSTCFVSGNHRTLVEERIMAPRPARDWAVDPDSILAALDASCRQLAGSTAALSQAGRELGQRYGFSDGYTLTKALGERLIDARRGRVPVSILRPAIVESALAEPIPGWIEGVRVADPLLVAYGRGMTRDFPGGPGATLEIVPVDLVVNALIAALAAMPRRPADPNREATVYQIASGRNPITLGAIVEHARDGFERAPLRDASGKPIPVRRARFVDPERYSRRLARRRSWARRLAGWLGTSGPGRRWAALERTLGHFDRLLAVYRPYFDHGASYDDSATRRLMGRLSPTESKLLPFDVTAIDWSAYLPSIHIPGLQRFALRAESGAPVPRRHDNVAAQHAAGTFPAAAAATLDELFALAAEADPTAVAFQTCRSGVWLRYTYGQALTTIANLASRLRSRHGIRRGDRVVLWGRSSPEWLLTSFAVHRLGAVTVPLDPQWPVDEVRHAVEFTEARLVCAAPELASQLAQNELPHVPLAAPFVPEPDVGLLPGTHLERPQHSGEDPALILFTSGTTVEPKAVPLTHDNVLANVRDLVPIMLCSRERLVSVLPIHHVFEFTVGQLVPLVGGATISYVPELKPAEINWMMNATQPTMLVAVPRLLELLHGGIRSSVEAGGPALRALFRVLFALSAATGGRAGRRLFGKVHRRFGGSLRRVATGGSALRPDLGRTFRLMGFQVAEGYGMTETSPVMTVNPWNAIRFGTVGRPLPTVEFQIRPLTGEAEGTGELWVRGPNVTSGYFRNPRATEEAIDDGWFNTGDVGSFDRRGYLRIAGRTKEVIVTSAGKNVYPEEVEARYRGIDGVEQLVVLGLPDGRGAEQVAAVVVPTAEAEEAAVRDAVARRSDGLPSYQRIARVEIRREPLPTTTTMKVQRGRLRQALATETPTPPAASPKAPRASGEAPPQRQPSADERWLLATLARATRRRVDQLTPNDRLPELGVDSLTQVELIAEIESRFACRVDDETAGALRRVEDLTALVRSLSENVAGGRASASDPAATRTEGSPSTSLS